MDPGRGCPAQIPDRGQYVHSSHRSEVEAVGPSHKVPREQTEHIDETGTGRAEGEEMTVPARNQFSKRSIVIFALAMIAAAALTVEGTYFALKVFVFDDPSDPLTKAGGLSPEQDIVKAKGK
jgi:hypothetical protein